MNPIHFTFRYVLLHVGFCLLLGCSSLSLASTKGSVKKQKLKRIALIIGHNRGDRSLRALQFAQRDASRLAGLLKELGGYASDQVYLLKAPTPGQVRKTIIKIQRRLRKEGKAGVFLFYYSGHARQKAFQLGLSRMAFAEVVKMIKKVPADIRLVIVDSCYSGQLIRAKGARKLSSIRWVPRHLSKNRGMAILTSSSASGRSFESKTIQGSLFTSSLLSGLRGAADQDHDQRVSLNEIYQYVYRSTLQRSTHHLIEVQRPARRLEIRGQGSVILSYLGRAESQLILPKTLLGHVFLYRNSALIQEFRKQTLQDVHIGLHAGNYQLRIRRSQWVGRYRFSVPRNGRHQLQTQTIKWKRVSTWQRMKGANIDPSAGAFGLSVQYLPVSNLAYNSLGVSLLLDSGPWLRAGFRYDFSFSNVFELPFQTHSLSLHTAFGYGWGGGSYNLWLGPFVDPCLVVRAAPQETLTNMGFSTGLLVNFDWFIRTQTAIRFFALGGMQMLFFKDNTRRLTPLFRVGLAVLWFP